MVSGCATGDDGRVSAAIGLDVGTTNAKAVLVDGDGRVAARSRRPLRTIRRGHADEQDADEIWEELCDAVAELTAAQPDLVAGVTAVGVCSQYSSIVPVDASARPVGPMVTWRDHRGTDRSWDIMARHEDAFQTWIDVHGIPPVGGGLALAHILFLQHDRPDIHEATSAYLEPMDYVTARLTGRITATQHSMFMSQLCDNRGLGATHYDDGLVERSGVDPDRLPPLIDIDQEVGRLDPAVAARLGLPAAAVVYAGSNDTAILGVASGASRLGRGGLAIGTTSVLVDTVESKQTDLDHEILSMPGLSHDRYLVFAENGNGGRAVEYAMDQLVYPGDALADHRTSDLFARLEHAVATSSPGADGTLFLPWLAGSLAPAANPAMRGGFVGVSFDTRRVDLVRAVTEGVAHNLAWLLPHVEAFTGTPIGRLVFVGGAARSSAWCQILADVLDRPVSPATDPDTAVAASTARLALVRCGRLDCADVDGGVEVSASYEPRPEHRAMYDLHQTQFEAAFTALAPVSEALTHFHSTADTGDAP